MSSADEITEVCMLAILLHCKMICLNFRVAKSRAPSFTVIAMGCYERLVF